MNALDHTDIKKEYDIKIIKVEPEIKKRAANNGLSAGRQLIFEKARNQGIDLSMEEIKTGSLSTLLEKVEMDKVVADNEPTTSPPLQSPEKVTAVVSPTSEQETATPAKLITPTPEPESTANKPSGEKTPGTSTDIVPANTKTPNISGDIGPSNTKTPNITVVIDPTDGKTPDSSEASIKIQHYNASKKVDDVFIQINTVFRIINTGNTVIDLKDVSFRYYYTVDSEKTQELDFWAEEGEMSINYKFVKMAKPVTKADYYLEVGFKGGQLEPGESTQVVVWFHKEDWLEYNQENDYSYSSSEEQEYRDWKYVTGYISGVLKWGIEP
ncbi:MAG: Xyloglucanase precursor [Firmicutes bacterium ADurb.Bin419]|nr:MAG: Xyloglucanase precursor [Firmicutes bacterium ADurb.Bin419]